MGELIKIKSSELHGIQVLNFSNKKNKITGTEDTCVLKKGMRQYLLVIDILNKSKKISPLFFF